MSRPASRIAPVPKIKLTKIRQEMRKRYGDALMPTLEERKALDFVPDGTSTQSLMLDLMIGRPGLPWGRAIQLTGLDGHGKSTLVLMICAETQRRGGQVTLADNERCYDWGRASRMGVDYHAIEPIYPVSLEQTLKAAKDWVRLFGKQNPGVPHTLVIDSIDGIPPLAVQQLKAGERLPGITASINGIHLPDLVNECARWKCLLVFVSQLSTQMGGRSFITTYDTKGGLTPKFRATIRMQVKRGPRQPDGSGFTNIVDVLKNKVGAPFRRAEYVMLFKSGLDKFADLWAAAKHIKVLKKLRRTRGQTKHRYALRLSKKQHTEFAEATWKAVVMQLGGPDTLRDRLTKIAIRKGYMEPYGIPNDYPPAESDAEREPTAAPEGVPE